MSNAEITVARAIEDLGSSTQKNREKGLADIKVFFRASHGNNLNDNAYHHIFEALFRVASVEKQVYLAAKTVTARSKAESNLLGCSNALRDAIKAATFKLRRKTIKAVIEHVIQLLPGPNGQYCVGLVETYFKVLSAILSRQAHIEQLGLDTWNATTDFCLRALESFVKGSGVNAPDGLTVRNAAGRGLEPRVSSRSGSSYRHHTGLNAQNVDDLMDCLLSLASASNAPVVGRGEIITDCLMLFLQNSGSIGVVHKVAFQILNHILSATCLDKLSLSRSVALWVAPVISRLWSLRSVSKDLMVNSVRDQMLISLMHLDLHFRQLAHVEQNRPLLNDLGSLEVVLRNEYSRRAERDKLQIFDLDLGAFEKPTDTTLCVGSIPLGTLGADTERNWAILHALAMLDNLLHGHDIHSGSNEVETPEAESDDGLPPRKRRRLQRRVGSLTTRLSTAGMGEEISALQICLVALPYLGKMADELDCLLQAVSAHATQGRADVSSWAMLVIASAVKQHSDLLQVGTIKWPQLWSAVTRFLTLIDTCRVASYLLHCIMAANLVPYSMISEHVDMILAPNGRSSPALLSDSTTAFMIHLHLARNKSAPGKVAPASQQLVQWLCSRWPPTNHARSVNICHARPTQMINVLRTSLELPKLRPTHVDPPLGQIAQSWQIHHRRRQILSYLLLLDTSENMHFFCDTCPKAVNLHERNDEHSETTSNMQTRQLIADIFVSKFRMIVEDLENETSSSSTQSTSETLRFNISACLIGILVQSTVLGQGSVESVDFETFFERLYTHTILAIEDCDSKDSITAAVEILAPILPACTLLELNHCSKHDARLMLMAGRLACILNADHSATKQNAADADGLEDLFCVSQSTEDRVLDSVIERTDMGIMASSAAKQAVLCSSMMLTAAVQQSGTSIDILPATFVDYIVSMDDHQFLLQADILQRLFIGGFDITPIDLLKLVNRVGQVLQSIEYQVCEVALNIALTLLANSVSSWADSDGALALVDQSLDIYDYFVNTVTPLHRSSCATQRKLTTLYLELMRVKPGQEMPGLPSPRTALLDLLRTSGLEVKFYIGEKMPELFNLFVLKLHNNVLLDIVNSLPSDPNWLEGTVFRIWTLAKLASSWPTLLRSCVYYVFEVPGRLPSAAMHATWLLNKVSERLGVGSSQELFRLFAPQLLYTWLEEESIENIPYMIFGYESLRCLVEEYQDEIAGLLTMRNQDDLLLTVAKLIGKTYPELLTKCFTKVIAYSVAHDISTLPRSSPQKYVKGEARVRKVLGKEVFFGLLVENFADIIALFFRITDQEETLGSVVVKSEKYQYAAVILQELKEAGVSQIVLPPSQQPNFRTKYLLDQIEHVCKRTQFDIGGLYTPTMVVFIARSLLDTTHHALGSLHACSVLRKLRNLIAIAGNSCLEGYCLEMLLLCIRPYMTNSECADDALGLVQYLFQHGREYLSGQVSFVTGISLNILASLRTFIQSSPPSTTLDSQYQSTLTKAQAFHDWFGIFLDQIQYSGLSAATEESYKTIVRAAYSMGSMGNAHKGTPESALLLGLLEDERSGRSLLPKASRDLSFALLYSDFELPTSFRNDILGDDDMASRFAMIVWNMCRNSGVAGEFLVWAAKVLGRSILATGEIRGRYNRESTISQLKTAPASYSPQDRSRSHILQIVRDMTLSNDRKTAGLAESALRTILSAVRDQSDATSSLIYESSLSLPLLRASTWHPFQIPPSDLGSSLASASFGVLRAEAILDKNWLQDTTAVLVQSVSSDGMLAPVSRLVTNVERFSADVFPFILHLVLDSQVDNSQNIRKLFSKAVRSWLQIRDGAQLPKLRLLINAILYLRSQPIPRESCSAERLLWLDLDYHAVAEAAAYCKMYRTALLFLEISQSEIGKSSSRRQSSNLASYSNQLLHTIFSNIDDPDMFYGIQQEPSLENVMARLDRESNGTKTLAFQSAYYDASLRSHRSQDPSGSDALIGALQDMSLDGLSHSLLRASAINAVHQTSTSSLYESACKLEQWDLPTPTSFEDNSAVIYKAFQTINVAATTESFISAVQFGLKSTMMRLVDPEIDRQYLHGTLRTLAVLTEMDEVLLTDGSEQFEEMLGKFKARSVWMNSGRLEDVRFITSNREILLSSMKHRRPLRESIKVNLPDALLVVAETTLISSMLCRAQGALQNSLNLAAYLTNLVEPCRAAGLHIESAVRLETANSLWDYGEMTASIGMLRAIDDQSALKRQAISVGRAELLAKLGQQISVARLEKPDKIVSNYLQPALKDLKNRASGSEAARVFHEFAVFCDGQLHDPDNIEDLQRLKKLKEMKELEVRELGRMLKSATTGDAKQKYHGAYAKARLWYIMDNEEYTRHLNSKESLLQQCLQNYLLSLTASDDHNDDALRFSALWFGHSEDSGANDAVSQHITGVPSRKFTPLINQLTSRLLDNDNDFQVTLSSVVFRTCEDHPYHGMYQIWAGCRAKPDPKDEGALSRHKATTKVARLLLEGQNSQVWNSINHTNKLYCQLAIEKEEGKYKSGQKIPLKNSKAGTSLNLSFQHYKTPPPTMQIDLSAVRDYSNVPVMVKLESTMSIASGVSAPKIITVVASSGLRFKQLVKGGSDDLRQDAIMEQVFAQVNEVLRKQTATRHRKLGIRTYKVLPLSTNAGIIEFVSNSIPLHEYLIPAHERYHPKDLKNQACRKQIADASSYKLDVKIKVYRSVTEKFHPVMRYFFMERFPDPEEWFTSRSAYTRSTAANSVLGHVLGLGDRHGHNILLDEQTGEVIHIDLGVAFEMGRILPVPELVPFRLTRDSIDGMGITRTEGIFRRCCEFMLEALRKESSSIMAILDVLRYDPLYSWSISPVRMAKLQNAHFAPSVGDVKVASRTVDLSVDANEADRALTVVKKKLSKALSVTATINDLINQATDEGNLASLYSGWGAYA